MSNHVVEVVVAMLQPSMYIPMIMTTKTRFLVSELNRIELLT